MKRLYLFNRPSSNGSRAFVCTPGGKPVVHTNRRTAERERARLGHDADWEIQVVLPDRVLDW